MLLCKKKCQQYLQLILLLSMAVFLTASYPPLSKPLNTVKAMTDYPLKMKAVGDGGFVVRLGMREEDEEAIVNWYWACNADSAYDDAYHFDLGVPADYQKFYGHPVGFGAGKVGQGIAFDGTNLDGTPVIDDYMSGEKWSASFWAKKDEEWGISSGMFFNIIAKGTGDGYAAATVLLFIGRSTETETQVYFYVKGVNEFLTMAVPMSTDWDHFAFTHNAVKGELKSYKNGEPYDSEEGKNLGSVVRTGQSVSRFPLNGTFTGKCGVDEIKCWDGVLTPSAVLEEYNSYA